MHHAYPRNWQEHFRAVNRHNAEFGWLESDTTLNLNAVNTYMHSVKVKTTKAAELLSDWVIWWETKGNPERSWLPPSQTLWDEARNRRLAFDLANATTPKEAQQVRTQATTGMSTEQMQGEVDRRDPTTGGYYVEPPPTVPDWVKPVFLGALAVGLGLSAFPLLRKFILPL